MKIIVDAFGGDNAPLEIIKGCAMAVEKYEDVEIILTGNEETIRKVAEENEISLDSRPVRWYTTQARARKAGVFCEEAGDCSRGRGNFRGVCPVSGQSRYAIGRLKPIRYTRISRAPGDRPATRPVCFSDAV